MRRKVVLTISIIATAVFVIALLGEPSVITGWLLIFGLTLSLIVTVCFLRRA